MNKICEYCTKPCKGKSSDCNYFEINTNLIDDDLSNATVAVRKKG